MSKRIKGSVISSFPYTGDLITGEKKIYGITITVGATVQGDLTIRDGSGGAKVFEIREHSQNIGNYLTKHFSFPNGILCENGINVTASGLHRLNIQHDY